VKSSGRRHLIGRRNAFGAPRPFESRRDTQPRRRLDLASQVGYQDFMARKPDPLRSAIQEAVRGAVADEARAAERKARREARRQEREADTALAAADPQAPLRERLDQLEGLLTGLRQRRQQGDALAGRLAETLEQERAEIVKKLSR
jgi:hypothetical protein